MKISNTHYRTKKGVIKRNPKKSHNINKWKPKYAKVLNEDKLNELVSQHSKKFNLNIVDDYNSTSTQYHNVEYIYSKEGRGLKPNEKLGVYVLIK